LLAVAEQKLAQYLLRHHNPLYRIIRGTPTPLFDGKAAAFTGL